MPIEIRRATPQDDPSLVALGAIVWPVAYAFAGQEFAQHTIDSWWTTEANLRSIAQTTMLVAVDGGEIVGAGNIDSRPEVPIIWKLAVHPDRQRQGIGRRLLDELLDLAHDSPVRLAYVDGNEQAARFYAELGFTPVDHEPPERPGWPGHTWVEWRRSA